MKNSVSIYGLISYCISKWKLIVAAILAFALGLGGIATAKQYKAVKNSGGEQVSAEYSEELELYETQVKEIEDEIQFKNDVLNNLKEYQSESIYMQLDPYDIPTCVRLFSIVVDEDILSTTSVDDEMLPEEYVLTSIQSLYGTLWSAADCTKVGDLGSISEKDKYLGELIRLNIRNHGMMEIVTYGRDIDEAVMMAAEVETYLRTMTKSISEVSYSHSLSEAVQETKYTNSKFVADDQGNAKSEIRKIREEMKVLGDKLSGLSAPSTLSGPKSINRKSILKYTVSGGLLGAVGGAFLLVLVCLYQGLMLSSKELREAKEVAYLGTVGKRTHGLYGVAAKMAGERIWKGENEAWEYVTKKTAQFVAPKKRIVFVSTLSEKYIQNEMEKIANEMKEKGFECVTIFDGLREAEVLNREKNEEAIIFLEKNGTTRKHDFEELKEMMQEIEQTVGVVVVQ